MNEDRIDQAEEQAEPLVSLIGSLQRLTALLEDGVLVVLLVTMIGMAITQIVLRNVFSTGILWGDGFVRVLVLWVGLLGAVAATRDDKQITVDVLSRVLPRRWKAAMRVVTDLFTALVSGVVAWHAGRMVLDNYHFGDTAFAEVPAWICQLVLPLAFGLIALRYLVFAAVHLYKAVRREEQA